MIVANRKPCRFSSSAFILGFHEHRLRIVVIPLNGGPPCAGPRSIGMVTYKRESSRIDLCVRTHARTHARIVVGQPAGARSRFPAKVARRESPRDSFVSAYKRPQSTDRLLAYQRFAFAAGQFREPAPARGPIVALGCRYRR